MLFQNKPFLIAKRLWLFYMLGIKPEGYAPEHNVLGNTPNTPKKDCMWGLNHEFDELNECTACGLETTKHTKYTKKRTASVEKKPQNTQKTQKKALHVV